MAGFIVREEWAPGQVEFVGDGTEESAHTGAVVADVGFAGAANCKNGYLSHVSDHPRRF